MEFHIILAMGGGSRARIFARGFEIDNIQEDGISSLAFASPYIDPLTGVKALLSAKELSDLIFYDRIEVLRGSATLTQSNSNPSGTINLQRKKAMSDFSANLSAYGGSYKKWGGNFDITGGVSENFSLRAIGSFANLGSFVDKKDGKRANFGLMSGIDISERDTLNLCAIYQKTTNQPNIYGLPARYKNKDVKFEKNKFFGSSWDKEIFEKINVFGDLEHYFDNSWVLGGALNFTKSKMDTKFGQFKLGYNKTAKMYLERVNIIKIHSNSDEISTKLYLNGKYNLFNNEHDFFINGTYSKDKISGDQIFFIKNIGMSKFHKDYLKEPIWNEKDKNFYDLIIKQSSITAGSRLNFGENWHLLFGAKFAKINHENSSNNGTNKLSKSRLMPYFGLNYDFLQNYTIYTSYAEIFKPQFNQKRDETFVKPMLGYNAEVGVKGEFLDNSLNASLAFFYTKRKYQALPETDSSGRPIMNFKKPNQGYLYWLDSGAIGTKGVEFEISGKFSQNLQGFLGYTFNKSKYLTDYYITPGQAAQTKGSNANVFLPQHTLKLYLSYQIPALKQLEIGFGSRFQSETLSYYEEGDAAPSQKAYVIFDANANYKFSKNFDINLAVRNLTDKRYFENSMMRSAWGFNFYGEPRNFVLNFNYKY